MSHWTKVEMNIDDLSVLKSACEELGAKCTINGFAKGWGGQTRQSDMVISIGGKYDLSVTKKACGCGYEINGDFYDGSLRKFFQKAGEELGKITEMYAVHKAEALCRAKRKAWNRIVTEKGINLEVFV